MEDAALGYLFRLLNDLAVQPFAFGLLDDFASHALQDFLPFVVVAGVGKECGDERGSRGCQRFRRAGQMWSVEMCPCRTFFSCTESSDTCFSGKATSMRRLSLVISFTKFAFARNRIGSFLRVYDLSYVHPYPNCGFFGGLGWYLIFSARKSFSRNL